MNLLEDKMVTKNSYEEAIDLGMIDYIIDLNKADVDINKTELKLRSLLLENKRNFRLISTSILAKDKFLYKNTVKPLLVDFYETKTGLSNLVQNLKQYLTIDEFEKKTFGEVFTPYSLINDMLDTLPKEVWSNPNLKWLDNSAGSGNIPAVVVERLMVGLESFESNINKRYKYIMENMIYFSELQQKNMFLVLTAFDVTDELSLNVYHGSFLDTAFDEHVKNVWEVDKFDIIVMNPPYNSGSKNKGSAHVLWDKFVIKSLNILIQDGYLVAVHPSGWRNIDGGFKNIQKLIRSKKVTYLEIHNEKDGLKTFGAETRYDFYCIKNQPSDINFKTKIKGQDGIIEEINISEMEFIPNESFNSIFKLIGKPNQSKVELLANSSYHLQKEYVGNEENDVNTYPLVYTVGKNDVIKYKYSNRNDKGHFGIPKFIWSNGRIISVGSIIDEKGELGLTQWAYAIIDEVENLKNIKQAFDSSTFRKLMEACAVSDMSINRKIIATFRKDFWKEFI